MPLYVFACPNHGRVEVLLPSRQVPYYLCERCGQLCERGATTVPAHVEARARPATEHTPTLAALFESQAGREE